MSEFIYKALYRDMYNLHFASESMSFNEFMGAVDDFTQDNKGCNFACEWILAMTTDVCEKRGWA